MATKVVNVDMDGDNGKCSCDLLRDMIQDLRTEVRKGARGAPTKAKKERKKSAWQEHLSVCLKKDEIQKLPFGDRMKKCSELYKKKK